MITTLNLPTLYAQYSIGELGRNDLTYVLYDGNNDDVTSSATFLLDASYASGDQSIFPIQITNLPITYIPGYLHTYFSGDLTIRPVDLTGDLTSAILLALQQTTVLFTPTLGNFQNLIIQELGQTSNIPFQSFIINAIQLWNTLYSSFPFLVYMYTKRHGISYLLGNYWTKYDSKEKDITEQESQQFKNLLQLLTVVEKEILYFTNMLVGFITPTAGELTSVFPIEFIGALYSPNSILYRGYPSTISPNPLLPQV